VHRRLTVGPDALLERAAQLGAVGLAHEVAALMIEGRVEEEALVLDIEVLVRLADATLAERDKLLAFGERTDRYRPFFECNRHRTRCDRGNYVPRGTRERVLPATYEEYAIV
jgi:hypothetical protein